MKRTRSIRKLVARLVTLMALAASAPAQDQGGYPATALLPVPHPRHWIEIKDGTPFVVPTGRTLVVMSVGIPKARGQSNPIAVLQIDGVEEVTLDNLEYGISMQQLPLSVRATEGQVVSVYGSTGQQQGVGRAWCYVVDNGVKPRALDIPHPSDWVRISDDQPYTVPPGKLLVVASGGSVQNEAIAVWVNGTQVLDTSGPWAPDPRVSPRVLPAGLFAKPGDVVTVDDISNPAWNARLFGYLIDP